MVRLAKADLAVWNDADVRPERCEPLCDRRVDAAVDETDGLEQVLAHEDAAADELVGRLVDLEPVVSVER